MLFNTLIFDMSNLEYHGASNTYSSSQLKTMIEDPEVFYKKYVTKEIGRESLPAFDVGTYFHTAVLEPEKLEEECAVFGGGIRRGKEWDDFKANAGSRAIITKSEKETADKLIAAIKGSPVCMSFLDSSKPEVSAFIEIYVLGEDVYSIKDETVHVLVSVGWVPALDIEPDSLAEFGTKIILKTRADALGMGTGIISDLKSTTGNCKNAHEMQGKVNSYQYDLSAALYLDVFSMASNEDYHTFVWLFASKDMGNARAYRATDKNIMVGRAKWKKAILDLAFYLNNNWTFTDSLGEIGPSVYSLEWLERI
jgi:hypothetical protein